jgi:PAS domain S-box-containing protein
MEAELRERKQKIEALHAVASDLETCESRAGAASIAVDAAAKVLDFDECVMRERTDEGFTLLAATSDAAPAHSAGNGLYAETLAAGDSVVVADLDERDLDVENPQGVRSALSVPVGDDAVLQALATEPGAFDADDVELAELLASHVADALERLAVRSELRAERDRFAALFDNVPDPVVAATHDDSVPLVTAVNPAFEETFGFDADEVIGENLDDLIVPPESEAVAVDANREAHEGAVVEAEVRRTTADGLRDFRLTVVPVELGVDSPATFGVYTDVTERKQRRKRVEVLNRVLRHDLRNGMNIVRGEAELLAADLDASGADHARTILDRADELQRLAERTRAVERSLDRDTSTAGPIDLARVVEETASDLRDRFPEAELTVETPDTAVVVGENLLELAVFDAMENALVHNDRSNPAVSVTVDRNGDDVVVSVADDGPGIPEAERRLLAGDEEITQLHHGSGLGLWLVHWAVTHSGGELSFDDNDPRGSVVTMRVPARTEAHPAQPAEE